MVDTRHIDLTNIVGNLKKVGSEYKGACPMCGGKDRFSIKVSDLSRWYCRQAENHPQTGDAISLLQHSQGLTFIEACQQLGIGLDKPIRALQAKPRTEHQRIATREYIGLESPEWQQSAFSFIHACADEIQRETKYSEEARHYLERKRYLSVATVDKHLLGWNETSRHEKWGDKEVYLPQGIVIPWIQCGQVWRMNVRRFGVEPKYLQVAGGANGLYLADTLQAGSHAVLVEGELDALTIYEAQPKPVKFVPVATGSTNGSRTYQWIAKLALCDRVAIAFDNDLAGNDHSQWWLKTLPNAYRLAPVGAKDVSDMWTKGANVYKWLRGE